jgi:hypothetical protein
MGHREYVFPADGDSLNFANESLGSVGDQFESANILGVDLSPIQPEWVPPNVKFMVDDVESP